MTLEVVRRVYMNLSCHSLNSSWKKFLWEVWGKKVQYILCKSSEWERQDLDYLLFLLITLLVIFLCTAIRVPIMSFIRTIKRLWQTVTGQENMTEQLTAVTLRFKTLPVSCQRLLHTIFNLHKMCVCMIFSHAVALTDWPKWHPNRRSPTRNCQRPLFSSDLKAERRPHFYFHHKVKPLVVA